jgi:hypothetical protein
MMRSALRRGMALPILCFVVTACGKHDANDPNTPAVVKAPQVVLESDTAKKVVEPVVSKDAAVNILSRNYALAGAAFSMLDPKLITAEYDPAAEVTTPNGTFTGMAAILKEFKSFGMDGTVQQFVRQSLVLKVVDSTVVDSGFYQVTRKTARADTTVERGAYAAEWRIHSVDWLMTKDHLYAAKRVAKKGK